MLKGAVPSVMFGLFWGFDVARFRRSYLSLKRGLPHFCNPHAPRERGSVSFQVTVTPACYSPPSKLDTKSWRSSSPRYPI